MIRYVPFDELGDTPNIVVDGSGNESTLITLSHWPHSGTPMKLKDDLSTQIVFNYLERPELWVKAEAVSNNHFDEDGLAGIFALLHPTEAGSLKRLLIDIASAGDFGTYRFRDAARAVFTLSAFADPDLSPLGGKIFRHPYPRITASLYSELLPKLPEIVDHLDRFRRYWEAEDALLSKGEAMIRDGSVRIEEIPDIDLAVVTLPEATPACKVHRFTQDRRAVCHPMALHNAIGSFRVLLMQGSTYELHYRYESWVQYQSRRPLARVDLSALAKQLSDEETGQGRWSFDGVDRITPKLAMTGAEESRIPPKEFVALVTRFLAQAPGAWNPYDSEN